METTANARPAARTFVVSLDNRKRRGLGHQRADEILVAARELFLTHGVENVTTRQIAAKVGISQTALYVYFASKEQMLDRLAGLAWAALDRAIRAADDPSLDAVSRLRCEIACSMRFWAEHPDDFRIVFARKILHTCASPSGSAADARAASLSDKELFARLAERVKAAENSGELRRLTSCESTALAIWTTVWGMVGIRIGFPDIPPPPLDEQIEATLDLIFNGCAVRERETAAVD